jgi:hypothetical protein
VLVNVSVFNALVDEHAAPVPVNFAVNITLPAVVDGTNNVPDVVLPVSIAVVGACVVVATEMVPFDVLPFFHVALAVPVDVVPPDARLWHDAFLRWMTDVLVPLPPVAVAGVQPVSVPFAVIVALATGVSVSPGLIVAVPLLSEHD